MLFIVLLTVLFGYLAMLLTVLCLAVHKVPDIVSRRVAGWLVAAIEILLQQGAAQHYLLVMHQVNECPE